MRKVALLGFADITRWDAPVDDPTWEIWGLGWDPKLQRYNRLFEPQGLTFGDISKADTPFTKGVNSRST